MKTNYYALLMSHDGILIVTMDSYNEKMMDLMNEIHPHYSMGGILNGEFIGTVQLGSHMISFDEFIKDVLEEAKYSNNKSEIESKVKELIEK